MKDNLLITLGDSWTCGVGVYDPDALARYPSHNDYRILHSESKEYALARSWPQQLANILDWDLINLALPGSANSAHAKWLINSNNFDINSARSQYKTVTVIWLLTDVSRFSLYSNIANDYTWQGILNIHTSAILNGTLDRGPLIKQFAESYWQLSTVQDAVKDTEFYVKTVINYCQTNGYNLLFGNAFSNAIDWFDSPTLYNHANCIHNYRPYASMQDYIKSQYGTSAFSEYCNHPNALGYKTIAEDLGRLIQETAKRRRENLTSCEAASGKTQTSVSAHSAPID